MPDDALRAAREHLIRRGLREGTQLSEIVSQEIEYSWRRSVGVEASARPEAFLFVNDFDPDGILIRAAKSVMDHWLESLNGMGISLFLSDQSGQIIARRLGDKAHGSRFDESYAAEGFSFSERSVGTNGLGTPIEGRQAVFVRGAEHFNDVLAALTCAGAPITHPVTRRVIGSISFACDTGLDNPLMLAMAREAGGQIERRLLDLGSASGLALGMSQLRLSSSKAPVIMLDAQAVMTNVSGLAVMSSELHTTLWEQLRGLEWTGAKQTIEIPSLNVDAIVQRIDDSGGSSAFALELSRIPDAANTPRKAEAGVPDADSSGVGAAFPHVVRNAFDRASQGPGAIAVCGQGGSGKLHHTLAWLNGKDSGPNPLILDACLFSGEGDATWFADSREAVAEGRSVVLRHLEDLPRSELNRLKALDSAVRQQPSSPPADRTVVSSPARLVLTMNPDACPDFVSEVVSQIAARVNVPALSATKERIPLLAAYFLDAAEPADRSTLSAVALQGLMRWRWPGNVAELRATLESLARTHPGRVLQADDLPEHLRDSSRRQLSKLESLERDAIVAALEQSGGNRSVAAESLGMGRTTLYRKLRTLGIETPETLVS
ncbi:sigma-54-dependent Fis family transcriptional regulator [Arthrobacter ginsengisoli]|uniref:sigma-54-dependent Fis family transcriptional regulator n=1 Tax=Arthrobacter ginsengisoli TaxID=1356565 RepID=UPI00286C7188|nr:helix-turn-helix domain-containing protein [Arthrobacter ginsengisoli]